MSDNRHPALVKLVEAKAAHEAAKEELRKAYEATEKPVAKYVTAVARPDTRWKRIPENREQSALMIARRLTNLQEFTDFANYWGAAVTPPETLASVIYYAIPLPGGKAVIERGGTGDDPLKAELLVDMSQWMAVVAGSQSIPAEWLK